MFLELQFLYTLLLIVQFARHINKVHQLLVYLMVYGWNHCELL
jgi:hypothetical protein